MTGADRSELNDPTAVDRSELDRRGWVLVLAIVVALLVLPAALILTPPTWLSYRFAFLALPVLPAVLLGLLAVWAALSSPPS